MQLSVPDDEVFTLIFKKLPREIFESFHDIFSGGNQNTFSICRECGGACERSKIGTLLPGEKEYMAEKMGVSVSEFEISYLDVLRMNDGTQLYVLKLGKLCPFLNGKSGECKCQNFKPIICKIYPIVVTIENGKINFRIDNWCKLSREKVCRIYFESVIPLLSSLPISIEWFRHVVSYDNLCFDYVKLEKYRNGINKCSIFSLEELLGLQKTGIETVSLCIDFSQEVEEAIF
jgi:Fe-S-cluster containining protein